MKVVHLSTMVNQSSANTRIHQALLHAGIDSTIIVLEKTAEIEKCDSVKHTFMELLFNAIGRRIEKLVLTVFYPNREKVVFSSGYYGINLLKDKRIKEADILHLHWVNGGYLSLTMLKKLIKLKKPMTGGCHVRYGCANFMNHCGNCPMLGSNYSKDLSRFILNKKKKILQGNEIIFACPSNWMYTNIKKSMLFKNNKAVVIPNPMDINLFHIQEEREIEQLLGYQKDKEKYHVLFGAVAPTSTPYKGFSYLMQALQILIKQYPDLKKTLILHIFGEEKTKIKELEEFHCQFWGYISSPQKLAGLYNLADVYVFPSIDDNLPGTVMESLSCGTPVVSFDTGGISDMVVHKENGYLAGYKDAKDFCEGVLWILNHNEDNVLGKNGRKKVEQEYTPEYIATKYIQLYQQQ